MQRRVFFIVFLSIQTLLPLWKLIHNPEPQQYGWQMFSRSEPEMRVRVLQEETLLFQDSPYSLVGQFRQDLDLEASLSRWLCQSYTEATDIQFVTLRTKQSKRFPCEEEPHQR